tara:strand:- start:13706 stop:14119 length:414 start_codon:yes stop_codon:yes gene_type:complete
MAYTSTVTVQKVSSDADYLVTIEETDVGTSSEVEVFSDPTTGVQIPSAGRILRYTSVLTNPGATGAGATVDPIVGSATNPSGINVILENGTAAEIVDVTPEPATYYRASKFFIRAKPDAGSSNNVSTRILIRATFGR